MKNYLEGLTPAQVQEQAFSETIKYLIEFANETNAGITELTFCNCEGYEIKITLKKQ